MKLPDVQYGRVQSLGRRSVNEPLRVAQAQGRAAEATGRALQQVNDQVDRLYQMDAESEFQDLALQYEERMQEETAEVTSSPYEETEDGELRSRHDKVYEEWQEREKRVREEIKGKASNNLAAQNLETHMEEQRIARGGEVAATAAEWTRSVSNRRYVQTIEKQVASGDHEAARDSFVDAASSGYLTEEQMTKIPSYIMADEQYQVAKGEVGQITEIGQFGEIRDQIMDQSNYPDMTDAQRENLGKQIDQRVDDSITTGLRATIETEGLDRGLQYVRSVNQTDPEKLGLSGEEAKYSIVSRLQSVYNDYKFQMEEQEAISEVEKAAWRINNGGWADPKTEGNAMDLAFEKWQEENEVEPFSAEWQGRIAWHAEVQGWVPPTVMQDVRGMLNHGEAQSAIAAANMISSLEENPDTARAVQDNMSDADIRLARMINDYAAYGQDPEETIKNVRQGLHQVPDSHRKARENEFNENIADEAAETLQDKVDDDPGAKSWYQLMTSNPEAGIEVEAEYRRILRDEYVRTGEKDVAAKRAYSLLRRKYAIVERGSGERRFEAMAPESIRSNGMPTPWITEEFNEAARELGRDPESLELVHFNNGGKHSWIFYDRETNDVVPSPDNPGQWATIDFRYENSSEKARKEREFEEEMRAAEIQRDRARAEERQRQRNQEQFEELQRIGPGVPGPAAEEEKLKAETADALGNLGMQFWEALLGDPDAKPGAEIKEENILHGPGPDIDESDRQGRDWKGIWNDTQASEYLGDVE